MLREARPTVVVNDRDGSEGQWEEGAIYIMETVRSDDRPQLRALRTRTLRTQIAQRSTQRSTRAPTLKSIEDSCTTSFSQDMNS